jgi:hypothetical protein
LRAARHLSIVDAKRGDHFLQADFPLLFGGCFDYLCVADFPGVGRGKQNAVTLNYFVRLTGFFKISASLIR